mgnify:CR=1 FL=1
MKNPKKILILGASSDIGITTTKLFLENGWEVVGHYNSNLKSLKKLMSNYSKLKVFKFDLKNIYKFEKYISKKNFLKNFDSFVSLTGYIKPTTFQNFKIKDMHDHINANYLSNLLIIRKILKSMKKKKWGRIVLGGSIGTKFGGGSNNLAYSLSKFNNEFFPSYYKTLYPLNIIVNTLQIGVSKTKLHKKLKSKNMKKRIKLIPLKRMANPDEIANYIYYLCSEKNSLLTGSIINASGGE